jgi:preprotein translocase subunit SecA
MATFLESIFGDGNKQAIKSYRKDVEKINSLESTIQALSDDQLRAKTAEFQERLKDGEALDNVKHEAFAVVREAAFRTLGQRHYDVQLIGGLVLHSGAVAEMRTGEGKTLTATTAAYLNALTGNSVHLVTVNDYLARRDSDWMGQVYGFLGLTVSCIQANNNAFMYEADIEAVRRQNEERQAALSEAAEENGTEGSGYEALIVADMDHLRVVTRREAYSADIIFGTNNEFGFDYLRDNMVLKPEDRSQGELAFAIIDEVDSILIDEARTPLIISAPAQDATQQYYEFSQLVAGLTPEEDFVVNEKERAATLTETGITKVEKLLGVENLYVQAGIRTVHHIEQALKARALFLKDKEYVVQDGQVIIVDEFTGRMMHGRRYSEGLHQAIEAKEGLAIQQESQTLATITLQNYFRLYGKLSGMTGTAMTEKEEFFKIYSLNVVAIPTHRENIRTDFSDRVYKDQSAKYKAVIERVKELHETGQPILLGTAAIDQNELMDQLLTKAGIPHEILNAKNHEREAEIIAQAGKLGAVTVATNMAGRGVDIILGGNPVNIDEQRKVRELGGLAVIGTERHEARRIDNQLRGRAGRQGDPGSSQFYVSMEDGLMRMFGSERMQSLMDRMGVPDDMPIENKMVTRSLETAQKKVESRNFDIRKHLVEYDDVVNKQRTTVYRRRNELLDAESPAVIELVREILKSEMEYIVSMHTNREDVDASGWDFAALAKEASGVLHIPEDVVKSTLEKIVADSGDKLGEAQTRTTLIEHLEAMANDALSKAAEAVDSIVLGNALRQMYLRVIDVLWIQHLDEIEFLRDSINLRGYGQRDPLVEYKRESFELFENLLASIQKQVVAQCFPVAAQAQHFVDAHVHEETELPANAQYSAPDKEMQSSSDVAAEAPKGKTVVSHEPTNDEGEKIGRNDPCYCGSGKKYKKCHGAA